MAHFFDLESILASVFIEPSPCRAFIIAGVFLYSIELYLFGKRFQTLDLRKLKMWEMTSKKD